MTPQQFWNRISACKADGGKLAVSLQTVSRTEASAFQREWERQLAPLRSARLWWQAYLASHRFKHFTFAQFTTWIILQGQPFHARALKPPRKAVTLPIESPALLRAIQPAVIAETPAMFPAAPRTTARGKHAPPGKPRPIPAAVAKQQDKLVFDTIMASAFVRRTYQSTIARFWPADDLPKEGLRPENLEIALALADSVFLAGHVYAGRFLIGGSDSKRKREQGLRQYRLAAEGGLVEAQYELGGLLQDEEFGPPDWGQSIHWLTIAADHGWPDALNDLGSAYFKGSGVPQSYERASELYVQAAAKGCVTAMRNLGYQHRRGQGVPTSPEIAFGWFLKAAKRGDAEAANNVGVCYEQGTGTAANPKLARSWYRRAANLGAAHAPNNLGQCHLRGVGGPVSFAKARDCFEKGAAAGHADCMNSLGTMLKAGQGIERDLPRAADLFLRSARQGYAHAEYNYGLMRFLGQGVEKDQADAISWYRKAAEKGQPQALCNLGHAYLKGTGVSKDETAAVVWFRLGSEQGNALAKINLGHCYYKGLGVARDCAEAARLFEETVNAHPLALENLGDCYEHGNGVGQSLEKSADLYRQSAERGWASGQRHYARMLENGLGLVADVTAAAEWYAKAVAQGDEEATQALTRLKAANR